jgi:RHS repeat-associated protein
LIIGVINQAVWLRLLKRNVSKDANPSIPHLNSFPFHKSNTFDVKNLFQLFSGNCRIQLLSKKPCSRLLPKIVSSRIEYCRKKLIEKKNSGNEESMNGKTFTQETMKLKKNAVAKKSARFSFVFLIIAGLFISGMNVSAQSTSQNVGSDNNADQNLKSAARINPSTLAMEFSLPFISYPGRNGNSMPVGFSYSSKVWRMDDLFNNYWYPLPYSCNRQYVSQLKPKYGERTISGWTSSLTPPIIEEKTEAYTQNGRPYSLELNEVQLNNLFNELFGKYDVFLNNVIENPNQPCGWYCADVCTPSGGCNGGICENWEYNYCGDPETGGCNGGNTPPETLYAIKRVYVRTPDGSTHEFRASDAKFICGNTNIGCSYNKAGTYLSVDGSGMRLERVTTGENAGSTLFMPNGSQYKFPAEAQHNGIDGIRLFYATIYADRDGNITKFDEAIADNKVYVKRTDTLGREITDPLPQNLGTVSQKVESQSVPLPGLGEDTQDFQLVWKRLKPHECEDSTSASCGGGDGALENQAERLYFDSDQTCAGATYTAINDENPNAEEYLFPQDGYGLRSCASFTFEEDGNGRITTTAHRFNPIVLAGIILPNGKQYEFKYNQWGEITKIIYPTGAYEKFEYGVIPGVSGFSAGAYNQANRGVRKRWVYKSLSATEPEQLWKYDPEITSGKYIVKTTASKGNSPSQEGIKTERVLNYASNSGVEYGFQTPLAGMPTEELTRDESGRIRSRTLTEWIYTGSVPTGDASNPAYSNAKRDARPLKSISIVIEGNVADGFKALATKTESIYQNPDTDAGVPSDASYFARLNVKQTKSYHYKAIDLGVAQTGTFAQIDNYFTNDTPAVVSETIYQYDSNYKARGISSLPIETRAIDPSNTSNILGKTAVIYDNQIPLSLSYYPYSTEQYSIGSSMDCSSNSQPKICWESTESSYPGRPTTTRVWNKDANAWIESHTGYDIFGNVIKTKDVLGNEASKIFTATYKYAYPEIYVKPAPDPTGTYGTSQTSQSSTTYDFQTGIPLTVTDDYGQTIKTEYDDPLLRPTKVLGVNVTAPIKEIIYNDDNLTVKVRNQIDETNWTERTTFTNSLAKVYKIQTKDLQGDVFVEAKYDKLGRLEKVSNHYRQGETILWSKPKYDEMGRVVESFAPAAEEQQGASLGKVVFGISTVTNFVGTYVMVTDASGRKARTISNKFGTIRVDEATGMGGTETADLGSIESPNQPTFYNYNIKGELVKITQETSNQSGQVVQNRYFMYDSLGRLIRVRQPEQIPNASLNTTQNPENNQWTAGYAYDAAGNVITLTDANNIVIRNSYDNIGRVKTRSYENEPSGQITPTVSYYYDGKGLAQTPQYSKGALTKISSSVSENLYTDFDNFGRLLKSQQVTDGKTYEFSYKYNLSGALVEETYPSGRVVRNFLDSDGGLATVSSKTVTGQIKTFASNFDYSSAGNIRKVMLGNGLWETAQYNERLQLTQIGLGTSPTDKSLFKIDYEYGELDANGNVETIKNVGDIAKQTTTIPTTSFVQTYKYDALNRLTEAKEKTGETQNWKQTFDYDRFGNRTSFSQIVGSTQLQLNGINNPTIDQTSNRFTTAQGYVYDYNGNLIQDAEGRILKFNGDNKQIEVKNVSNNQVIGTYFYDGTGARVKKVTNTETIIFVYSHGKLVAEYSTQMPAQNPSVNYLTTDHLGSPRVISNRQGVVTSRQDFMPFGEEIGAGVGGRTINLKYSLTNTSNIRQRFTGYEKDTETNLDFAEARMYQNQHGRFTAVDPLMISGDFGNPQSFNRYIYTRNNPVNYTDPSGLRYYRNQSSSEIHWFDNDPGEGWEDLTGKTVNIVASGCIANRRNQCAKQGEALYFTANGFQRIREELTNKVNETVQVKGGVDNVELNAATSTITNSLSEQPLEPVPQPNLESSQQSQGATPEQKIEELMELLNHPNRGLPNGMGQAYTVWRVIEIYTDQDLLPDAIEIGGGFAGLSGEVTITRRGAIFYGYEANFAEFIVGNFINIESTDLVTGKGASKFFSFGATNKKILLPGRLGDEQVNDIIGGENFVLEVGKGAMIGVDISPPKELGGKKYYTASYGYGYGVNIGLGNSKQAPFRIPVKRVW